MKVYCIRDVISLRRQDDSGVGDMKECEAEFEIAALPWRGRLRERARDKWSPERAGLIQPRATPWEGSREYIKP